MRTKLTTRCGRNVRPGHGRSVRPERGRNDRPEQRRLRRGPMDEARLRTPADLVLGARTEDIGRHRGGIPCLPGAVLHPGPLVPAAVQRRVVHHQRLLPAGHLVGRKRRHRPTRGRVAAVDTGDSDRRTQDGTRRTGRTRPWGERQRARSPLRTERPLAQRTPGRRAGEALHHRRGEHRDRPAHQPPHRRHAERHAGQHRHQALRRRPASATT